MSNKTAVALGSFDGLHKGHISVIACTLKYRECGLEPFILLFDEHPVKVLKGTAPEEILQPVLRDKILSDMGISKKVISFSEIKDLSPEEFFDKILIGKLNAGALCCGSNYHFGKNGAGNEHLLKELCEKRGIELTVSPDISHNGSLISSSRIRTAIKEGNILDANAMLGREFTFKAIVKHGCQRGRLIGAPTINQYFDSGFVQPKAGVYASLTVVDGKKYHSVTNIGLRPTFENEDFRSETCILNYSGNLYGEDIEVRLLDRIRDEIKFNSEEELKNQIKKDAEFSEKYCVF